ncbi:MAG: hypothetical protein R2849_10160 [Thermomicrobiales bacterium]
MSWLLCGGSLGLFLPILLLLALNHHASEIWQIYEPQAVPASVAAIVVGWFLASRRPGNGLGWFFLVAALLGQISDLSAMYAVYGLETRPDLPGAAFSLYLSLWLAAAMLIAFPTVPLLLFPDGRLAGRWSRIVAAGVALSILILVGGLIAGEVIPPGFPSIFERTHHPFNSGPPPGIQFWAFFSAVFAASFRSACCSIGFGLHAEQHVSSTNGSSWSWCYFCWRMSLTLLPGHSVLAVMRSQNSASAILGARSDLHGRWRSCATGSGTSTC